MIGYYNAKLHFSGLLTYTTHKWLKLRVPEDACSCNSDVAVGEAPPLGMENVLLLFIFVAGGILLATLALFVEWAYAPLLKKPRGSRVASKKSKWY